MGKFNQATAKANKVVNLAGGEAFDTTTEWKFASLVLTSFVEDQFYRSENETLKTVRELISKIGDKKFLAKTAIYARQEFGMRSISHVIAGELANAYRGEKWIKHFITAVIRRPDDMTEIMAYQLSQFGRAKIPSQLKKGLAKAFDKFNEYQLAKYRSEGQKVSLVDVVNLVRPKPTPENDEALRKLVKGELVSFDTWEVELTKAGQTGTTPEEVAKLKALAWKRLITERKLGYFALLRNLRNIIEQAPDMVDEACVMLKDEKLIKKSLVLPFRYFTAYDTLGEMKGDNQNLVRVVRKAVGEAMDIALGNIPIFDGDTLVVLDESGSMGGGRWATHKAGKRPIQIGSVFAASLAKTNNADLMSFADDARYRQYDLSQPTMTIVESLLKGDIPCGTDFKPVFRIATKAYKRIIFLTDFQGWVGYSNPEKALKDYRKRFDCDPVIYSFDLAGYGSMQFPERNVYAMAGFSEKLFEIMPDLELDRLALVNKIRQVDI